MAKDYLNPQGDVIDPNNIDTARDFYLHQVAGKLHPGQTHYQVMDPPDLGIADMPWHWPIPGYRQFNRRYVVATPNQTAANTWTQIGTYRTPQNYALSIKWLALVWTGIGFADATGAMQFQILINNNAVADWGAWDCQVGTVQYPQEVQPIWVKPVSTITLNVCNVSLNPVNTNVIALLRGHLWPVPRSTKNTV
ncbi:MAG: hypothetical protein U0Q18_25290 [Bryobacteraceae bacterium]